MRPWINGIAALLGISSNPSAPDPPHQESDGILDLQRTTALHEIGHAIIAWHVTFVTSLDGATALNGTGKFNHRFDHRHLSSNHLWCKILIKLGGVCAEAVVNERFRTLVGRSDLESARHLCGCLLRYFPDSTCPWKLAPRKKVGFQNAFKIPLSQKETVIIDQCYDKAYELIEKRKDRVLRATEELSQLKKLDGSRIEQLLGDRTAIRIASIARRGLIEFD